MSYVENDPYAPFRDDMMRIIEAHAIHASAKVGKATLNDRVLAAIAEVPRHEFVLGELLPYAYLDGPLPIGFDKTISQPFIVALMTDLLEIRETDAILEVGTGLGYHAAVLARLARTVHSVEIIEELGHQARRNLERLGYTNVELKIGDGSRGWPEHAPFDRILVAAAPDLVPAALLHQLRPGGRMVVPAGIADAQQLLLVEKDQSVSVRMKDILPVLFGELETYN